MRLHFKKAHPVEYNLESETNANPKKKQWTEMEIQHMADLEVRYGVNTIGLLDHLVDILGRTKESIKGRRKKYGIQKSCS